VLSWELISNFAFEDKFFLKIPLAYDESNEGLESKALIEPTPFSF